MSPEPWMVAGDLVSVGAGDVLYPAPPMKEQFFLSLVYAAYGVNGVNKIRLNSCIAEVRSDNP
ncbi:hypothetical protein [Desulfosporosinus metallidurans]|uniref:Uncharacterized protein n=1 Tax=Desulfosporosinus metallidurans TaxID=1888891 RepID=A0A1Q8QWV8_9FIRM|nr:hypothetical protein [Desulfosporosinus metallidurans]OLN31811.1 hypothetical protein DSOL_2307 [Desulfosporosinus metallidurans]